MVLFLISGFVFVQVLKTKVLRCDPENSKLLLSFKSAVQEESVEVPWPHLECEVGKGMLKDIASKTQHFANLYVCVCGVAAAGQGAKKGSQRSGGGCPPR